MSTPYQPAKSVETNTTIRQLGGMTMSVEPPEGPDSPKMKNKEAKSSLPDPEVDVSVEKKKSRKKKSKRKQPTGFEESYAEAPVTPAEFEEEAVHLYHPRPFNERIETCIQRYRSRRKMTPEISNYFDHYLSLGGISTKSNMFSGGIEYGKNCELDAEQIARIRASDYVDIDKVTTGRDSSWVVDWEGIAKGFFSDYAPERWDLHSARVISDLTNVVDNFLRYVLHHNVCPEYAEQIAAARTICQQAKTELSFTIKASQLLPGQFGVACSVIFGGRCGAAYQGRFEHSIPAEASGIMSYDSAVKIFKAAVSVRGSKEQIALATNLKTTTLSIQKHTNLEIVRIEIPTQQDRKCYDGLVDDSIECFGVMICREWDSLFKVHQDLTAEEEEQQNKAAAQTLDLAGNKYYEFWVPNVILECCRVGMKLNGTVGSLDEGKLYFLDEVNSVYCSFYTYLLNRQLENWVLPRPWNKGDGDDGTAALLEGGKDGLEDGSDNVAEYSE